MNIKFKTLKTVGMCSIIALCCIMGCTKEYDDASYDDVLKDHSVNIDYEKIGNEHNKGLDYIFENLKNNQEYKNIKLKSGNSHNVNTNDIFNVIEKASISFVATADYGKGISENKFSEIMSYSVNKEISLKSANANNVVSIDDNVVNTDDLEFLTVNQRHYINRYKEIVMSIKGDIAPVIKELKKLDAEIISNCTSEEAVALLSATSVGRHSLQYWNDNLYKWAALFTHDMDQAKMTSIPRLKNGTPETYYVNTNNSEWVWFNNALTSMGQSDGVGALLGAGLGAPAGGVGAIPGAIGGACIASANAGIVQLLKKWGIFE